MMREERLAFDSSNVVKKNHNNKNNHNRAFTHILYSVECVCVCMRFCAHAEKRKNMILLQL